MLQRSHLRVPLPRRHAQGNLDGRAVLRQGFRLYRRLLAKTLVISLVVFAPLQALVALAFAAGTPPLLLALLAAATSFGGLGLLQGSLVEIVWDQHEDGNIDTPLREVARRCADRVDSVLAVSLALFVPGLALAGRWLLAVPVLVLEDMKLDRALRRARELATANERALLRAVATATAAVLAAQAPFLVLADLGGSAPMFWLVAVAAAAITVPYVAHTSIVAYYALTQPYRPIVLDPGESWSAGWPDGADGAAESESDGLELQLAESTPGVSAQGTRA